MSIDISSEMVRTLANIAKSKSLPPRRRGKRPNVATFYRWSKDGCLGKDGKRVILETIQVGGTRCTSDEALQRFFDRLTHSQPSLAVPALRANRQAVKA